ncbi:MAG: thiamine-phosphate kinase [Firmicutes bacterium]|nr:thiamine-phosphate kinase [Bacillota bacterium]
MEIKNIGEFELIDRLTAGKGYDRSVLLGIGDDAAVFLAPSGVSLLACTDMLVEGVHFLREKTPPAALGHKALAANLSDIAAMGGIPRQALVAAGWPPGCTLEYVEGVYKGLHALAEEYGVNIIGGDTVRAPVMIINITIIGESRGKAVGRNGARPGDLLAVTGRVGAAAAGLALLRAGTEGAGAQGEGGLPEAVREDLIRAQLYPVPRLRAAAVLAAAGAVTAMIDLSDGLAGDLRQLTAASGVGALLYGDELPIDGHTRAAAAFFKEDAIRWALYGGEDYELLAALAPEKAAEAREKMKAAGVAFTVIGKITPAAEGLGILQDGRITPLKARGFDHFSPSS